MGRVVVIGSSNTDMIVRCEQLPKPGETVLGNQFTIAAGGKGANQAVAAARLGAQVALVARVGRDAMGQRSVAGYRAERINCENVSYDPNAPSGVALILVDSKGENLIGVAPGANSTLDPEHVERAEACIREADVALVQLEIPLDTVAAVMRICRKWSVRVILNPAPARELAEDIFQDAILTPNEKEVEYLAGIVLRTSSDLGNAARGLLRKGARAVIVTRGEKGAFLALPSHVRPIQGFAVEAVDTTAAGDAFNGGLAVALSRGDDMTSAARYACAVGALSVTRFGAQPSLPTAAQVDAFLRV